jgi:hypothetical protein
MKRIKTYMKNGNMSKTNQEVKIKDADRYGKALEMLKTASMDDELREVCEKALTTALLLTNGSYDENSLKNQQQSEVTNDNEGLRQRYGNNKGENEMDFQVKPCSGEPQLEKGPDWRHLLGMLGILSVVVGIAGWFQVTDKNNSTVEGRWCRGWMVAVGRLERFVALQTFYPNDNKKMSQQRDDNLAISKHKVQRFIPREGIGTLGVC